MHRVWHFLLLLGFCFSAVLMHGAELQNAELPDAEASAQHLLRQTVVVVVGAPGTEEYAEVFDNAANHWRDAASAASAEFVLLEGSSDSPQHQQFAEAIAQQVEKPLDRLWLVLIGHGTFDGNTAKFNLTGPDISAAELAEWLEPVEASTVVINCASSSGPFINQLSAENRVVVTATKSGYEMNYARFGKYLAEVVLDPAADLDKDDQVSLLEAFLTACRRVEEFYEEDARLMTEHALVDDNGDGLGTPATWFRGLRATQRAKEGAERDGVIAHQIHLVPSTREANIPVEVRQRRDNLEREIASLREQKSALSEKDYYQQLEDLMVELARIYQAHGLIEQAPAPSGKPAAATID